MQQPLFNKHAVSLIIGLGNPGARFVHTRHNIGFRFVDELCNKYGGSWREKENMAYAVIRPADYDHDIYLVKPTTFMNKSGAVMPFFTKKGIVPGSIIVVHDEMEKKLGSLLLSFGGSARGHNGIKSLHDAIGKDFWRLRIGIGRPESHDPEEVGDYVLGNFSQKEEEAIPAAIDRGIKEIF